MTEFKDEMRLQTGQLNKKWGELSNRLGTLAEDFAAPNIPSDTYLFLPALDESVVNSCTKKGIYAMALKRRYYGSAKL